MFCAGSPFPREKKGLSVKKQTPIWLTSCALLLDGAEESPDHLRFPFSFEIRGSFYREDWMLSSSVSS